MAKKIKWVQGDVFAVPLLNQKFSTGQVLDLQMVNVVRIALYDEVINDISSVDLKELCKLEKLISVVASSKEQLDYNVWKIIGNKEQQIPISKFPNEQFRSKGWVGAKIFDAALVENFLNSFYALLPWNDWADPNYLDRFLIDPNKRPTNLVFIKK